MAQQNVNVGASGNDGTGDDLRTAGNKINNNFSELYGDVSVLQATAGIGGSGLSFDSGGIRFEGSTADSHETLLLASNPTSDNTLLLPDSSGTIATVSRITQIVDSAYVSFITGTAFDSASTITLIRNNSVDSVHALLLIDSAYIQFRQLTSTFDTRYLNTNGDGVISGSSQITDLTTHKETVSGASSYTVDHNLGEQYPIVQAWNTATSQQELPNSITTNSTSRVTVVFSTTFAGIIIVKK